MKLDLPINLTRLFGPKTLGFRVGLSLHAKFIRLVKGKMVGQQWQYVCHDEVEIDAEEQWAFAIGELITKHQLNDASCCIVLPGNRYQMLQIDKPAIPDAELGGALAWAIKDLVNVPGEDIVADFFHLPVKSPGQGEKINVIVSSAKTLRPIIEVFHQRKVKLDGIVPEELVIRNVIDTDEHASLTLTQQKNEEMILQIIKGEELYIARKLRGFNRIHQYSIEELEQGLIDNLYLEIQRSMDFFGSQLKQSPVKNVLLALPCEHQGMIVEQLNQLFNVNVGPLLMDRKSVLLDESLSEQFFPAIGGALEYLSAAVPVNE